MLTCSVNDMVSVYDLLTGMPELIMQVLPGCVERMLWSC